MMEEPMRNPGRILITGASGLIGTALVRRWTGDRIPVVRLIRGEESVPVRGTEAFRWDPSGRQALGSLESWGEITAAVHLSGANVAARRWSRAYKQEIVDSRVASTTTLVNALTRLQARPRVLVCASAIGIYGDRGDEILTEEAGAGGGFLAEVCAAWEAAAAPAEAAGIRLVHLRLGVVLAREGGALAKLAPLFRFGLGGKLGSGAQWMPWLTLRDAAGMIGHCLDNEAIRGPVNGVAPTLITNGEFTRALGKALHRPTLMTAPAFALRLAVGQMADEALLASARVVPEKLLGSGYRFLDPEIGLALRNIVGE